MHCASYTAHKSHRIRLITLHAFQEHGIVWTRERSLMVFRSWIIIVIYILLIAKFWCTNHPLQKGDEALYSMIQIVTFKAMSGEHFEVMFFWNCTIFPQIILSVSYKTLASSYHKMYHKPIKIMCMICASTGINGVRLALHISQTSMVTYFLWYFSKQTLVRTI